MAVIGVTGAIMSGLLSLCEKRLRPGGISDEKYQMGEYTAVRLLDRYFRCPLWSFSGQEGSMVPTPAATLEKFPEIMADPIANATLPAHIGPACSAFWIAFFFAVVLGRCARHRHRLEQGL